MLVEGPAAVDVVAARFRAKSGRSLKSYAADRLVFGRFGLQPSEEVVVRCRSERSVELHCHGGDAAVAMVERLLTEQGCRTVAWQDWLAGH